MEQYADFNTAFVILDDAEIEAFIDVAFIRLRREAKKIINAIGTFSITMTVEALKTEEAKKMTYVEELFNRVVFDETDRAYHKELYEKVKELCLDIEQRCPQNESLDLAFNAFSLGLMHIGKALSHAEKYKEV